MVRRSDLLAPRGMFAKSREAFASSKPVTVCDAAPADAHAPPFPDAHTTPDSARERSAGIYPELSNVRFARDRMGTRRCSVQCRDMSRAPAHNRCGTPLVGCRGTADLLLSIEQSGSWCE
jgi:hypothetical protein